jgi:hypothetical protein
MPEHFTHPTPIFYVHTPPSPLTSPIRVGFAYVIPEFVNDTPGSDDI